MNRGLQRINLLGVAVLAALCVFQWQRDRSQNLALRESEKTRRAHEQKIGEQDKALHGLNEDLTQFKEQISAQHKELTETRDQLGGLERTNVRLTAECDQLRGSITNWSAAVNDRDQWIQEANTRITDLAKQLNESIQKYNQLATNHNDVVSRYNELAQKVQAQTNK